MAALKNKRDIGRGAMIADLRHGLRNGTLAAGDKLVPIRELVRRYGVSQWVVKDVIEMFERQGLLESRERSGVYVKGEPTVADAAIGVASVASAPPDALAEFVPEYYLNPVGRERRLSIYVSDGFESTLEAWCAVLGEFRAMNPGILVDMLTWRDGHVQQLWGGGRLDVVHSSPRIFHEIGADKFLPLNGEEDEGLDALLPPLRRYTREDAAASRFVPCSLTLKYLYVNTEMLSRMGAPPPPRTPRELLDLALEFEERYARDGEYGTIPSEFPSQLAVEGVLSPQDGGGVGFAPEAARHLLERLGERPLACMRGPEAFDQTIQANTDRLFATGRLFLYPRHSYFAQMLTDGGVGNWMAVPRPAAPGAPFHSDLCALGVAADSPRPREAALLVDHLRSRAAQSRFARLPGNLAIYAEFYDDPAKLSSHPVGYETIRETLDRSNRGWVDARWCQEIEPAIYEAARKFFGGLATAGETSKRLGGIVNAHNRRLEAERQRRIA